jgi:hypothetical protein
MKTTIIGEILPRDLVNCEALNVRHGEYHTEIQHREPQKNAFVAEGRRMIQDGNALSQEINSRIEQLEEGFGTLYEFWSVLFTFLSSTAIIKCLGMLVNAFTKKIMMHRNGCTLHRCSKNGLLSVKTCWPKIGVTQTMWIKSRT